MALVIGTDGLARCPWGASTPEYVGYHDTEWGGPVTDDDALYERLTLEAFQSGLSWLTILRKREGFRAAFAEFAIPAVAAFGDRDVARLLADTGIVRNRAKIDAAIANARAALELPGGLAQRLWSFAPKGRRARPKSLAEMPATTPDSTAMAKDLKSGRIPLRRSNHGVRPDAGDRHGGRPSLRLSRAPAHRRAWALPLRGCS